MSTNFDSTETGLAPTELMNEDTACIATNLLVTFPSESGAPLAALRNVNISLKRGKTVGVVGESGSGKSMLGLTILGLAPANATIEGSVIVEGTDMLTASEPERRKVRRHHIGLVLQDPGTAMNPVRKVRSQMEEALRGLSKEVREKRIVGALTQVGLDPNVVLRKYPFQLSGGMQQRVVIAMAIMREPTLLVADEPTTALDVTTQASVLGLLSELQDAVRPGILFISHDLSVIRQVADEVVVLYGGRIFEQGPASEVIGNPRNPYTVALLKAIPRLGSKNTELISLPGYPKPSRIDDPGCPFRQRCPRALARCSEGFPDPTVVGPDHMVACWNPTPPEGDIADVGIE